MLLVAGEGGADLLLGGLDGHHGAAFGQRLHEGAAGRDQPCGVLEGEDAGHVGGGEFADGVAGEELRCHAPGFDEAEHRGLQGEERGLGTGGPVEQGGLGRALLGEDDVADGLLQVRVELGAHRVEGLGELGVGAVKFASHAETLGALSGEEEGQGGLGGGAGHQAGRGAAFGQGVQAIEERLAVLGDDGGAVFHEGPGGHEGVGDIGRFEAGAGADVPAEPGGLGPQGLVGARGQDPGQRAGAGGRGGRTPGLAGGCLFQDDVGVGAADAEGGDGRAAHPVGLGPGLVLREEPGVALAPVDVGGGLVQVEGPGQLSVPHRQDHLDDAGDTGRRLGVPDVGLQGADQHGPVRGPVPAVRGEEGLGLDGVAEGGAGAVGLDGVDVGGDEAGAGQGLADDALLGRAVGGGQAVGGAVLVDGRALEHGEHLVAVALGVGEPFDQYQSDALAPSGAVGGRRERLAAAVGRQPALPGELHEHVRGGHHGRAAHEGEVALAPPQGLRRQVQGDQ
ncbi:hypothetical protein GCM10009544_04210 [Streptomyces stramineus]|uniref:Uncharacterized protein n=1 Tax=Streptomyces stramineus TaxID=173861 RepID=A0ABP3J7B4_9ACTN